MRTVLNVQQGTPEWLAARAASDGTASEAPVAAGKSKYQSRTEFLQQRKTGLSKEVDAATQKLFDRGHETEALARPMAESIIGEDLSPITVALEIAGLKLLASVDGITFDDRTAWEHKLWNEGLAAQVRAGQLDEHYTIQLDQILLVTGAERVLFMVSDGTEENCIWMWYYADPAKFDALIATWQQFHADLAEFVPQEFKERIKADAVESMPVPSVVVEGKLVSCNLDLHIPTFDRFLAETKTDLKTDEDFAQGEANAKTARDAAKALKQQAKAVIDQIAPVSHVVTVMEAYSKKFDTLGLSLEKAVKDQKDQIRSNAILKAKQDWAEYLRGLETELKTIRLDVETPDFASAVKGVRTIAGLHSKVNDALAAGKAQANTLAQDIRNKLAWCKENAEGYGFLFADLQQIIYKPMDDFQLLINTRVKEHKEAERLRIEKEAQARAAQLLEEHQQQERVAGAAAEVQEQPKTAGAPVVETKPEIADQPAANDIPDTGETIKMGEIHALLGFQVTGDFIIGLGFNPAEKKGAALLFKVSDVPLILEALANHVQQVRWDFIQKKAA